ncbi:BID domain-containing T4SS effector [Bartonella ancashensis]|uniref:protein adenylyltransferase n=1 Tax=Bartonella ancashensis TaxID=1318743 RepID=A0A0M4LIT1_9HYPH|nr:BID domain-containing T4SS effector [Bartonella ancashensis]ALE03039.1 hypothetical protein PU02_0225 [Bartonella ancashensis]ARE31039.1 Bep225 [Bartonella ancashensis]
MKEKPNPQSYFYPRSEVLKNKYGIKDAAELKKICLKNALEASADLRNEPLPEEINSFYLLYLHRRLFEKTFGWAGHTRDAAFAFPDGTFAQMLEMKSDTGFHFAHGLEIKRGLYNFDKTLREKDYLKNLSHGEFVREVTPLFVSLDWIRPFKEGNRQTQKLFFEKLANAAGYTLDFSLVTNQRFKNACIEAMERDNLEPMRHMFKDISQPQKMALSREVFSDAGAVKKKHFETPNIVAAKDGATVEGVFVNARENTLTINMKNDPVTSPSNKIEVGKIDALRADDHKCFTPLDTSEILIPGITMRPLTPNRLSTMLKDDPHVQKSLEDIQRLSHVVYGNPAKLDKEMAMILDNPKFSLILAEKIQDDPASIAKLAGAKHILWKNDLRKNAENHARFLSDAIVKHGEIVSHIQDNVLKEYQQEQERQRYPVVKPSESLQRYLSLPLKYRKELLSYPGMKRELNDFVKALNNRLPQSAHKAIEEGNHAEFAKAIDVPFDQAQKIAEIVTAAKDVHKYVQVPAVNRAQNAVISHASLT